MSVTGPCCAVCGMWCSDSPFHAKLTCNYHCLTELRVNLPSYGVYRHGLMGASPYEPTIPLEVCQNTMKMGVLLVIYHKYAPFAY